MKRITLLILLLVPALFAQQPKPVQKTTDGTHGITENLNFNGARTLSGTGTFDFSLGTLILANNQVLWASVNKSGSSLADLATRSASDLSSGTLPDARFPATLPALSGANLTALNASNLASGTLPDARFPATLPAVNGSLLTNLNASALASGTVPNDRLAAIPNTALANSAITVAGNSVSLGGSVTQDQITGLSSTGLVKRTGANALAIATSGTDYAPATSGSSILYGNGSGGFSSVTIGSSLSFSGGTLDAIQDIRTTASPTFAGGTFNGLVTSAATSSYGFAHMVAGTSLRGVLFQNDGGAFAFGVERGTGGQFISGSPGYAAAISTFDANPILFGVNNVEVGRFTSTGLNNTVIGATTPAAGSFTTLSASSFAINGSAGQIGTVNSTNVNGPYVTFSSSSTAIGDIGSATQLFGAGTANDFGINSRSATFYFGTGNSSRMTLTSTGLAVTGTLATTSTISVNAVSPSLRLGNQSSSGGGATLWLAPSNSVTNWMVGVNQNVSGALEITPSTAGGGTTFTTPVVQVATTGLSVTGTLGASGNVWSGNNSFSLSSGTTDGFYAQADGLITASRNGSAAMQLRRRGSDGTLAFFYRDTTEVGSISVTTTSTAYNVSSDERLKKNIREVDHAKIRAAIDAIAIRDYDWRINGQAGVGPIAQELAAAHPILVQIGAVTPGDGQTVDYVAWRARKARVDARAERNGAAIKAHRQAVKAAMQEAEALEKERQERLGKRKLRLIAKREALLNPPPPPVQEDEDGNVIEVSGAILDEEAQAKRDDEIVAINLELAGVAPDDLKPITATLPPEPVLESHPEDNEKDFVQWQVDHSKLVPLLVDYSQQLRKDLRKEKQRIDAVEVRLTALEPTVVGLQSVNWTMALTLIIAGAFLHRRLFT